jgi:glycosyltransferase involved in cell wall biosynthesis
MVLTYHEVVPEQATSLYAVSSRQLEEHLRLLADWDPPQQPRRPLLDLTFDDGHISHYRYALPLLDRFGFRATFFITAGWTGSRSGYMAACELRELLAEGHAVQAHGWSHKMLTQCSPAELYDELHRSKETLEDILGIGVDTMSLPHGRWNRQVLEACAQAGYKKVYTSDPSVISQPKEGVVLVARRTMTCNVSSSRLEAVLSGQTKAIDKSEVVGRLKSAARRIIGERFYHRLWCAIAREQEHPVQANDLAMSVAKPKRILQLISSGGYYGAESMLVNLAASLGSDGWQNVVGVFRNSGNPHLEVAKRAVDHGLQVEVINCGGRMDWRAIAHIKTLIYRHGIDLVHTHGFKPNFYATLATPSGIPLVATYHLDWPDRGVLLHCYHLLDRVILKRFAKVVAVSEAIAKSLVRSGLGAHRVQVIANGIDFNQWPLPAPVQRVETGARKKTVVGVVGRLVPQKGHIYLLQAAQSILSAFPQVEFLFVGDGPERARLEQATASLGLSSNVRFAGQKSDMATVYAGIDILVLPSINEGMPMTLIEALAAGCPVVATAVGDVEKLIRDGETGLLVEPRNPDALSSAIAKLLSDPVLCLRFAEEGRKRVLAHFSARAMADEYREVYSKV